MSGKDGGARRGMQLDASSFRLEDWYPRYGLKPNLPKTDDLLLSQAVHLIGDAICDPFDPDFPLLACLPLIHEVPGADEAFVADRPVPEVHARWAAALHAVWRLEDDLGAPVDAGRNEPWEWLAGFHAAGHDRLAAFSMEFVARAPAEPIDREDWNSLAFAADGIRQLGMAARDGMRAIGTACSDLVADRHISLYARPFAGHGKIVQLTKAHWNLDDPFPLIASCSIDPDRPHDPAVEPTHLVFVSRTGFDDALAAYARKHRVELHGMRDEPAEVPYPDLHDAIVGDMLHLLRQPGNEKWRKPHLQLALGLLDARWKNLPPTSFERARAEVGTMIRINTKDGPLSRGEKDELIAIKTRKWQRPDPVEEEESGRTVNDATSVVGNVTPIRPGYPATSTITSRKPRTPKMSHSRMEDAERST